MKTLLLIFLLICSLSFAEALRAQVLTGAVYGDASSPEAPGNATSSSLTASPTNFIAFATGDFAGLVLSNSFMITYYGTISGLSTTPLADSINSYFMFSGPDTLPGRTASGTTPNFRFDFNLATVTETSYSGNGIGDFLLTGTVVDTLGVYSSSPADITIDFYNPNYYNFSLQTVPEPSTLSLVTGGLLGLFALRRRKA